VQEVRDQYQVPVVAVITLADLMQHVSKLGQAGELSSMRQYRERYGLAE
jgi:orotate phosphoribosyltransferase